jgi:hypothetical protein
VINISRGYLYTWQKTEEDYSEGVEVNAPTKVQNSPKEEEVFFPEEVRVVRKEIAYILKVVSTH